MDRTALAVHVAAWNVRRRLARLNELDERDARRAQVVVTDGVRRLVLRAFFERYAANVSCISAELLRSKAICFAFDVTPNFF